MRSTFALRLLPSGRLMAQPTRRLMVQPTKSTMMRPTNNLRSSAPHEEQAAHYVSQRLARLRQIPPELIPLGVVVAFAIFAAGYSIVRKFVVDKNLRLTRQGRSAMAPAHGTHHDDHHEEKAEASEEKSE